MSVRGRLRVGIALLALCAPTSPLARTDVPYEGGIGIGYSAPRSNRLSGLYDPGPSFHLFLARRLDPHHLCLGLEVGYIRRTADLSGPFFVGSPRGSLTRIPIELTLRAPLRPRDALSPLVGIGGTILWARERFDYDLAGQPYALEPEDRADLGLLLLAGFERTHPPRLRIEGTLSVVPSQRRIVSHGWSRPAENEKLEAGSIGIRLHWRIP